VALSVAVLATRRNRATLSGGSATHAIHAPLGHTRTGAPSIVSVASPVPTEP
jgi:hypothetical protein